MPSLARAPIKRQRGGVLLIAAILVVVISMAMVAMHLMRTQSQRLTQATAPAAMLTRVDAALAAFVSQHKRLPCPARGSIASGVSGAGTESINLLTGQCSPADQADGVVPWLALGLSEADVLDPWHARISYRVQPSLASNLLLLANMSWCDPDGAMSGASGASLPCTSPCNGATCRNPLNYLYAKGLAVRDGTGAWLKQPNPPWPSSPTPPPPSSNGAAYVLVSHGVNGVGAYNASGVLQPGSSPAGSNELANRNGQALTGTTVFIDTARVSIAGPAYFDDLLSHPSLSTVLSAAALGPRAH